MSETVAWLVLLQGCVHVPSVPVRVHQANTLASAQGWTSMDIASGRFDLRAYVPRRPAHHDRLAIYIEGDGFAWYTRDSPSSDPTPIDPVGLRLALAQPEGTAVYLARPCQYVRARSGHCRESDWTGRRFGPEVVAATNRAVQVLKQRYAASHLTLIGYSGGAAVAVLVAARRKDVDRIITVAGNLDPRAWAVYHHVSPLRGSLDPMQSVASLEHVRMWCLAGDADRDVPPSLIQTYADRFPRGHRPTVIVLRGTGHHHGWVDAWPALWRRIETSDPHASRSPEGP